MAEGEGVDRCLPGAGRLEMHSASTTKGDIIVRALQRSVFLVKQVIYLPSEPASCLPNRKPLHPSTCYKFLNNTFGVKRAKQQYTKTESQDRQSVWPWCATYRNCGK